MSAWNELLRASILANLDNPLALDKINAAGKVVSDIVEENEQLKADLKESLRLLDCFVTVTYTAETILDANNLLKKLKGAKW